MLDRQGTVEYSVATGQGVWRVENAVPAGTVALAGTAVAEVAPSVAAVGIAANFAAGGGADSRSPLAAVAGADGRGYWRPGGVDEGFQLVASV